MNTFPPNITAALRCTLFLVFFFGMMAASPHDVRAQQPALSDPIDVIQAFAQHHQDLPREQAFILTDRERYFWGNRIWFSAFVTAGADNLFSGISRLLYVELYDDTGSRIDRTYVRLENGSGHGSLTFGETQPRSGTFTLTAYTSWMLNFEENLMFRKPLQVTELGKLVRPAEPDTEDISLAFFPESGQLLAGVTSEVVVKASLPDGRAAAVSGEIRTASGERVATFETDATGLGAFRISPEAGQRLEAVIPQNPQPYELAGVQQTGVRLNVQQDHDNGQFVLHVQKSGGKAGQVTVFGHHRGRIYYLSEMELSESGSGMGWAAMELFPPGAVEFIVLDERGDLIARRPVLMLNDVRPLRLSAEISAPVFGPREQVRLRLNLRNETGMAVQGMATVSVSAQEFSAATPTQDGFPASRLKQRLLADHLLGFSEPALLLPRFLENDMLTHADWLIQTAPPQDFAWELISNPEKLANIRLPENGFSVSGTIRTGFRGRPVDEANVIFAMGPNDEDLFVIDTNEDGRFLMSDIDIMGSSQISIRATDRRGRSNVRIGLDEQFDFLPDFEVKAPQPFVAVSTDEQESAERIASQVQQTRLLEEQHIMAAMQLDLEAVTVTAEREDVQENLRRLADGDVGGTVLRVSDRPELQSLTIFDLLMRLPGVQVSGNSIRVRTGAIQNQPPILLIDGAAIEEELIASVSASDVDNISVLRRPDQLARFGAQGATGVISIRTIRGEGLPGRSLPVVTAFLKGFDEPPPFFSPNYTGVLPQLTDETEDNRLTLHWQPNFVIRPEGREILFWTGDRPGTYCATIEGLSTDGRAFSEHLCFDVE
ncbi:hypothetical protein CYPRO_1560 [Cyclonatronum proteinivorum]|uniref:TonB-dependent outer membrane receptor, SusC/RagA subfamily, signature region n=1 Tax=Cyclonatronum proteinivorum TaxID=1457365 RepID=A0A345UK09_9BACT|nr:hypothetical protein [Cyclonatronum proteinivorum]AXJ00811.1 hypothetical protein CYPRO_1560 [Cyclonatronum proteinivorum]